ncbi:hypothetical protein [Streptomyces sp. NPDC091649]|uniref:hypothetical protein n=1 Tax=Streptomyces sp. NPDC091649 TaxID=3366004 RepID=UPI003802AB93
MGITIRWKNPGDPVAMAYEVNAAYQLRIRLQDPNGNGITTPEALVAEEMADAMDADYVRIHGYPYINHIVV